jgi:hypothetical protein
MKIRSTYLLDERFAAYSFKIIFSEIKTLYEFIHSNTLSV